MSESHPTSAISSWFDNAFFQKVVIPLVLGIAPLALGAVGALVAVGAQNAVAQEQLRNTRLKADENRSRIQALEKLTSQELSEIKTDIKWIKSAVENGALNLDRRE